MPKCRQETDLTNYSNQKTNNWPKGTIICQSHGIKGDQAGSEASMGVTISRSFWPVRSIE